MKLGFGSALAAGLVMVSAAASGQVSAYADLSASKLSNANGTNVLYGPTVGISAVVAQVGRVSFSGDLRASFLGGSNRLDQVSVGAKFSGDVKKFEGYAEFATGFGRYNPGTGGSSGSTDGEIQVIGGVDRAVTKHFDWRVFEFGYEQYYGIVGTYNPKTFSTGVVYHLGGRKGS